jgi:ADP-ribose pyrophosphatase YjhB (NUDIX family)
MNRVFATLIICLCLVASDVAFSQERPAEAQVAARSKVNAAVTILLTPTRGDDGKPVVGREGAVPFSILIADHTNDRGHAPFGGTVEPGEKPRVAAARESAEESRFQFKEDVILKKLNDAPEVLVGSLAMYVIVVDYVSPKAMDEASSDGDGTWERQGYAWMPVEVVDQIVASDDRKIPDRYRSPHAKTDHMWSAFAKIYPQVRPEIDRVIRKERERWNEKAKAARDNR